jgi:hypothetical protein
MILLSCKTDEKILEKKLNGQWAIDSISYNKYDYKEDLRINFMVFDEENKISLPASEYFEKDKNAKWFLKNEDAKKKLIIQCSDQVFNGEFSIEFIKENEKKILGIELKSDSTYIKAFKFFQNYEKDGKNW